LCDELFSFGVWNADGVCCSGLDVQTAPRRLGEFLRGLWFSKSSKGGYEKPWCLGNALPLYRLSQPKEIRITGNHFHHLVTRGFTKNYTCWNKHGEEGLNELEADCLNEGEVLHHATNRDEALDDNGLFEENEPLLPPNVLRLEDITNQEVRGFHDGEVLQRVHNVDQMLRDVEFQRVYTPSELARLKQFIEDSKKPLYPDCQKYSRLSGDLKLLQLKADHGWSNKSFKHLLDVLRDILPEGNQIAVSVYEAKIICPLGIEVEKIHACKNSCVLLRGGYAETSGPSVAMIGTRGKRMVEMIIMLMTITSPARSEARRRRLTEGLL
jgi:hypothetical protein